jgi:K+-sensing histidine kinase KdpD
MAQFMEAVPASLDHDRDIAGVCPRRGRDCGLRALFPERLRMNLSCIVCAIDGADTSQAVLASARSLAAWDDAELHVMHLADSSEPISNALFVDSRECETTIVRGGDPATAVVDRARHVRADLIVIGATLAAPGSSRLARLAEAIARDAHCATLIVRDVHAEEAVR